MSVGANSRTDARRKLIGLRKLTTAYGIDVYYGFLIAFSGRPRGRAPVGRLNRSRSSGSCMNFDFPDERAHSHQTGARKRATFRSCGRPPRLYPRHLSSGCSAHVGGGVQERPPGYAAFTRTACLVIPTTKDAEFYAWMQAQIDKPYDWRADPSAWFCSELGAAALEHIGAVVVRTPANRITPNDLFLLAGSIY